MRFFLAFFNKRPNSLNSVLLLIALGKCFENAQILQQKLNLQTIKERIAIRINKAKTSKPCIVQVRKQACWQIDSLAELVSSLILNNCANNPHIIHPMV